MHNQPREAARVIDAMRVLEHRGLPVALDSERMVLAACIMDGPEVVDLVTGALEDSAFSTEWHRHVFTVLRKLRESGEHIDRLTVHRGLESIGQADIGRLIDMETGMPSGLNIEAHVRRLAETDTLRRAVIRLNDAMVQCLTPNAPRAALDGAMAIVAAIGNGNSADGLMDIAKVVERAGGIDAFGNPSRDGGDWVPMPKEWPGLVDIMPRFRAGGLTIVAARTSVGKSAFATCLALYTAMSGYRVDAFTLEMTAEEWTHRMIANHSNLDGMRIENGRLSAAERQAFLSGLADVNDSQIHICDLTSLSLPRLISEVRKQRRRARLVIVDYLQLMDAGKAESRQIAVAEITRGLKRAAGDLGVHVVALSQLKRGDPAVPPELSDLRESGAIEQDANRVMMMHTKPEEFGKSISLVTMYVKKNRGGRIGHVDMTFLKPQSRFIEEG